MRIVHIADFLSTHLGYQELLLAKWNAKHGHEVSIVTSNRNPPAPDYRASFEPILGPRQMPTGVTSYSGLTIHRLPVFGEYRTRIVMRGLSQTVIGLRPEAIFCHGTMSPTVVQAAQSASKLGVPLFVDNHMVFSVMDSSPLGQAAYFGARQFMRSYLAPRVEKFYGVAQECSDFLIQAQGVPSEQVDLLPLGVDTETFDYSAEGRLRVRANWGLPDEAVVIAQTGKMDVGKDPVTLARAAARVAQAHDDTFVAFVGSGPVQQAEAVRAEFAGLEDRLVMASAVPVHDLADVFSACDVVVFPGGTSMSSLEAAACGRVVVMNDLPASKWRAEMGVGVTFPDKDVDALAELLTALVEDGNLRKSNGERAQASVVEKFSYDKVARHLELDIANALERRSKS